MSVNRSTELIELPSYSGNGESHGFYTPTEASRIARIPHWTLNSWRREGVIVPSVEWIDEQGKAHLGHTFETLIYLRLIRMLRENGITLLKAVEAVKKLNIRFGPPSTRWADARIFTQYRDAFVYGRDEWATTVATRHHQSVADALFGDEFARLKKRADALLIPQDFMAYVEIDPAIRNGLPIVLDTSVLTSVIHSLGRSGHEYSEIHAMYPFIPSGTIRGADRYENFLDKVSRIA